MAGNPVVCPGCRAPLTGAPACPSCQLRLTGPDAGRLWQVDQRLIALEVERNALTAQRELLLEALRSGVPATVPAAVPAAIMTSAPGGRPVAPAARDPLLPPPPTAPAPREVNPRSVQNTLLALGALMLAGAGIVFAAVTYQRVGPAGRATILLLLTAVAALAPERLVKRGLTASAEAVAGVAVVLALLDAWALQRAGLAAGVDELTYAAVATGLIAALVGGYAAVVPLQVSRIAAVLLAQLPVIFVLLRTEPARPVVALVLATTAAVDLLVASERRLPKDARATLAAAAIIHLAFSLTTSVVAVQENDRGAGVGLAAVALVLAAASAHFSDPVLRAALSGSAIPLLAAAAWVTSRPSVEQDHRPLVLSVVALLTLAVVGLLPHRHRLGPGLGSLAVAAGAVLTQAEHLLLALFGPFTWLSEPWSLAGGASARGAVSVDDPWSGTVVALVVVAAAAFGAVVAGLLLEQLERAVLPTAVLVVLSAVVLPLGIDATFGLALALLVLSAAGLAAGACFTTGARQATLLCGSGTLALLAAVWSVADRDTTLVVLPLLAVLAAGLSWRIPLATSAAALLAGAALAAVGADAGLPVAEVGLLLLVAPAICVGLSFVLTSVRRVSLEGSALVLATAAVVLTVEDLTLLSVALGISGLLALALAIRPDRHDVALLGGLLLSAASWVRLADAEITDPEPYAAPLALTALAFGHLRRRTGASSYAAYGPGLSVALFPTLLKSFEDETPTRGLVLLIVCVGVVVVGAQYRLKAPLAIGGGVLALDVLHLLTPAVQALPRGVLLALGGALVLGVGVTYEQRRLELARLRERYDQLS